MLLPPIVQEYRANYKDVLEANKKIMDSTHAMADDTDKQASKMGKAFGGAAKIAAGAALAVVAAAATGIAAIVKVGFEEVKEASAVNAQLEAGIKSTGGVANTTVESMNALATSIQNMSGQTDDSIAGAQSLLLTFTNIRNVGADKIFDQTTLAAANMAAKLGGDAASQAMVLGKALNDPIDGVTKLTRAGVQFTDAQKAQIKALQESGDMIGAQKIILGELETQFGGAAEAAGKSLPGSLARARRAFEDLSQGVMEKFLPIVTPAISALVDKLQVLAPIAENVAARIADALQGGGAGISALFNDIGGTIQKFVSGGGLLAAFNTGAELRDKLFNGILEALPGILDAIVSFIPQLVGFITGTLIPQFVSQLSAIVTFAVDVFTTLVPKLIEAIAASIPALLAGAATAFMAIVRALVEVIPTIISALVTMLPKLITALTDMIPSLIDTALTLFNGILIALVEAIPIVVDALVKAIPVIITALTDAVPKLIAGALDLFLGLISGLGKAIPMVIVAVIKAIPQLILALVSALPDLIDGAIQLFLGIVTGLVSAIPEIITAVVNAVPMIVNALIEAAPLLLEAGVKLMEALIGGVASMGKGIADVMKTLIAGAINGVIDLINGAIDGINSLTKGISDATNGQINISLARLPKVSFDVGTARVPGAYGAPLAATVHGGEAILSNAMLEGREPVPARVVDAVQRQTGAGEPVAVAAGGDTNIDVHVTTNASPRRIAAEIGWELRRRG